MNKNLKWLFIGCFFAVIFSISLYAFISDFDKYANSLSTVFIDGFSKAADSQESILNQRLAGKPIFMNTNGLFFNLVQKHIVGNYEFVKDSWDNIHIIIREDRDLSPFTDQMISLQKYLRNIDSQNSPDSLLYLQLPSKYNAQQQDIYSIVFDHDNAAFDQLLNSLSEAGITTKDLRDSVIDNFTPFFKTDVHLKTEVEFNFLPIVIKMLELQGLFFPEKGILLDRNNYEIIPKKFVGNCSSKYTGETWAGADIFEIYYPAFETDFSMYDIDDNVVRTGNFENVVMNNYDLTIDDTYKYYVTDYMQFGRNYYRFKNNNNPDGPSILLDMDSYFYRTAAFLSLFCSDLTVIDTRFDSSGQIMKKALMKDHYDSIIVASGDSLIGSILFCESQ